MQLQSHLENDGLGLFYKVSGEFSGKEIMARGKAYFTPGILQRLRYQIGDLREVDSIAMTAQEMREMAEFDIATRGQAPTFKIALVCSHDLMFSISQLYSTSLRHPHIETRVFRTLEDARAWIDSLIASGVFDHETSDMA